MKMRDYPTLHLDTI